MKEQITETMMVVASELRGRCPDCDSDALACLTGGIAMLRLSAHWRDGAQRVGTCGTKLGEVEAQLIELVLGDPAITGGGDQCP